MASFRRGINLCGPEFGETVLPGVPGTHYTWNSEPTFRYFAAHGLDLFRIPVLWERLQPAAFGPLAPDYLEGLRANLAWAAAAGGSVVLDVHNFARYYGVPLTGPAPLADLWVRLSAEFRGHPALYAYGLMNEPHDLGPADWRAISQSVLDAIRDAGDPTLIMVPGDAWSSAARWPEVHGPASWIRDPAANFAYEAHLYFDDGSGRYPDPYSDSDARHAPARLAAFLDWCRDNAVRPYLGEYGVPSTDLRWLPVLDAFLTALDAAGCDGTCWAAGEWWGDYPLSVQPLDDGAPRPQFPVLTAHLGA